ncbi:MAG: hypothetical protein RBT63_05560 [Bdellovibrionales bacterium]|jgi:hypothetical protein|nr:hypothetical protein [Bdellovibrionales bacterium]
MKKITLATIVALAVSTICASTSFGSPIETPPWSWRKGSFGVSSTTEYFFSQANYGPLRGEFSRLTGDNSLTDFNTWVRGRYAFWPKFSMYAGLGLGQTRAVDAVSEKTNSGLTEGYIGGHFTVWRQWLLMVAEVEAGMPLDAGGPLVKFNRFQTIPLVADGSYYGRALLHMRRDIKSLRIFGYVGARIPTDGLAKQLLYGAYAELPVGDFLMFGGGVDGHEVLMNDELTQAERDITLASANAGSARFRSFDPAILRARGWVGFKPGRTVEIRAGYMKTLTGLRDAEGSAFTLNVVFSSIPKRLARGRVRGEVDRVSAPGNTRDFKLDSERTDPDVIAPTNEFQPQRRDDLNETERLFND